MRLADVSDWVLPVRLWVYRSYDQKFALVLFHMLFVAKVLCHRFFVAALALTARLSWLERF